MPRSYTGVLLLLFTLSCGGSPSAPSDGEIVKISGVVQEFSTGTAVPGATVTFGTATAVTNASGVYQIAVPALETHMPTVEGVRMGTSIVHGSSYRGDSLVHPGTCVARYGIVSDIGLHRPIAGATVVLDVAFSSTVTDAEGWYRIDAGCPPSGQVGTNTSAIRVSHPNYAPAGRAEGRGFTGVYRVDIQMQRN